MRDVTTTSSRARRFGIVLALEALFLPAGLGALANACSSDRGGGEGVLALEMALTADAAGVDAHDSADGDAGDALDSTIADADAGDAARDGDADAARDADADAARDGDAARCVECMCQFYDLADGSAIPDPNNNSTYTGCQPISPSNPGGEDYSNCTYGPEIRGNHETSGFVPTHPECTLDMRQRYHTDVGSIGTTIIAAGCQDVVLTNQQCGNGDINFEWSQMLFIIENNCAGCPGRVVSGNYNQTLMYWTAADGGAEDQTQQAVHFTVTCGVDGGPSHTVTSFPPCGAAIGTDCDRSPPADQAVCAETDGGASNLICCGNEPYANGLSGRGRLARACTFTTSTTSTSTTSTSTQGTSTTATTTTTTTGH